MLTEQVGDVFDDLTVGRVHGLAYRYLDGRAPLFDAADRRGRACDGHGDLLADDIFCLDDGPRVLDCIEFDDDLRLGDALADVAFLAMDLDDLGRPDLAEQFLAAYREHAADVWPASLAHHHVAYRAQVRAKVTAIRAEQGDEDGGRARSSAARPGADPSRGRPGAADPRRWPARDTGSRRLAEGVAARFPAAVLRSDVIRKELVGPPGERGLPLPPSARGSTTRP